MSSCPSGENWESSGSDGGGNYCVEDFEEVDTEPCDDDAEVCLDKASIRSKSFEDDEGDKHVLRFGCPVGEWKPGPERCDVGTEATSLWHPKEERKCDMEGECPALE